jgi:hypothetical protein
MCVAKQLTLSAVGIACLKSLQAKVLSGGGHCFGFPDFLEDNLSMGGYGSGTYDGEGVSLLDLKGFVC